MGGKCEASLETVVRRGLDRGGLKAEFPWNSFESLREVFHALAQKSQVLRIFEERELFLSRRFESLEMRFARRRLDAKFFFKVLEYPEALSSAASE